MGSGARASRTGLETGTEGLTSGEVNAYMLDVSARLVVESAKREAADLRALLRYLYLAGLLEADLGTAMPPVAAWRGTALPTTTRPAEVDALIASCDRSSRSGRRDRVVLVLMARLGLRAGEVAAVQLEDIDWRAGSGAPPRCVRLTWDTCCSHCPTGREQDHQTDDDSLPATANEFASAQVASSTPSANARAIQQQGSS
jgi:hypothetical protein